MLKKTEKILVFICLLVFVGLGIHKTEAQAYCYLNTSTYDISLNLAKESDTVEVMCYPYGDLPDGYSLRVTHTAGDLTSKWTWVDEDEYKCTFTFLKACSGDIRIALLNGDEELDYVTISYDVNDTNDVIIHYMSYYGSEYQTDVLEPGNATITTYAPSAYVDVYAYWYEDGSEYSWHSFEKTFTGWNTEKDGSGTWYDKGETYTGSADLYLYPQYEAGTLLDLSKIKAPDDTSFVGWRDNDYTDVEYDKDALISTNREYVVLYGVWGTPATASPTPISTPTPTSTPTQRPASPEPTVPSSTPSTVKVTPKPSTSQGTSTASKSNSNSNTSGMSSADRSLLEDDVDGEKTTSTTSYYIVTKKKKTTKAKKRFSVKGIRYRIESAKKQTVSVVGVTNKNQKKYELPVKVRYQKKNYKIICIRKNAFKGCKKVRSLVIRSKSIQKIEKGAVDVPKACKFKLSNVKKYQKMIVASWR